MSRVSSSESNIGFKIENPVCVASCCFHHHTVNNSERLWNKRMHFIFIKNIHPELWNWMKKHFSKSVVTSASLNKQNHKHLLMINSCDKTWIQDCVVVVVIVAVGGACVCYLAAGTGSSLWSWPGCWCGMKHRTFHQRCGQTQIHSQGPSAAMSVE